ncbi:MAG: SLBB domain-containing protein [Syntrophales bacterium]|jgi:protein involved in polysaccharide export with SLBB domain|nr:SLBB domain-containing protein [Syntrophales bacterium]MCK9392642.1 SLBB domain-containing protein [Syntrophales bacterium]
MKIVKKKYLFPLLMLVSIVLMFNSSVRAQMRAPEATPNLTVQAVPIAGQQDAQSPSSSRQMTPQQADALQKLSPIQQQVIQQELGKTGGQLTPQAVEALKGRPEFKGVSPDDVVKGKQLLEQNEKAPEKEAEKKESEKGDKKIEKKETPWGEKTVIGGETRDDSLFERSRTIGKYQGISLKLSLFGTDFFRDAAVRVVTDQKDIPVPLKYVVGPGDEVKILLWGRLNAQYNLTVDRNGKITVPQMGPMFVAGMTFEDMSKYLVKQAEQIVGTNIDISMGALKTISIFVLGDVRRPGAYTIGSFATITDALLAAGGPSDIGTMRRIQLKRKDKLLTTFDLYDLLMKGDKSHDMVLQAGDIVFVPVTGALVGIAGNIKRPAIYELKDYHDLEHLIDYAGGIIPTAYTQQIQVERIIRGEKQVIVDINDKNLEKAIHVKIQDADLVKVFSIVDVNVNVVYLNGNIKRPGKYEFRTGMTIKDLLGKPEDYLPETYFDYALVVRMKPPSSETSLLPFNLGKMLFHGDQANNIALQPQDRVFIFSKWFFKDKPSFTISGEVRKGGQFDLADNCRIKDAILAAGDLTKDASLKKGEIIRTSDKREYQTIYFDVGKAASGDSQENILLQDEDQIVIHSVWEEQYKKSVSIDGEVLKPGIYPYTEDLTVKELVFRAGNVRESAYLDEAEIVCQVVENGKIAKYLIKNFNLRKALAGDPADNLKLKPYDRIMIKGITDWRREEFVTVSGEVKFPGRYAVRKDEKISSLIERVGGYTSEAYLRGVVFKRESVRVMQQEGLTETAKRLERELLAQSALRVSTSLSAEEVAAKQAEIVQKKKLIETMKQLKATGRMTIRLANQRLLKGSEYDIELDDGDTLYIPPRSSVVNVLGAVMSQGSYIFLDKFDYKDYISMSGGYSNYSYESETFVLKTDGSARKLYKGAFSWNDKSDRWEMSAFGQDIPAIEPGDTIVVPEKLEGIAWLREIRDITQILMNTAVVAGVVIKLF